LVGQGTVVRSLPANPGRLDSPSGVRRAGRPSPGAVGLRVDQRQKRYGATEAVAGVSFDIREGEVFGLLGRNGAGKTTTIAMLATATRPSDGDAWLFDQSLRRAPQAVRRLLGVVPPDLT